MKKKGVTTTGLRDYNIITNRYLELHDEKTQVDSEVQRLDAAKKYWKSNDFDPVNGSYYDPDKEKEFVETWAKNAKEHGKDWVKKMPKTWQEKGSLYNPINCDITDQQWLYEYDLKEKNKWKRYELRYDMERLIRKEGLSEEERVK